MKSTLSYHKERNILEINPYHPLIQELNKRVEVIILLFRKEQINILKI
jgi:HSP90 family molecular chaperone